MRPDDLAEAVDRHGRDRRVPLRHHLCEFLDEFSLRPDDRQRMIEEEPPLLGSPTDDAYVAGVAEHLAVRWRLTVPAWVDRPERFLARPYFVGAPGPRLARLLLAESPVPFRKRMVFTEAEPLRRATMRTAASEDRRAAARDPGPELSATFAGAGPRPSTD